LARVALVRGMQRTLHVRSSIVGALKRRRSFAAISQASELWP